MNFSTPYCYYCYYCYNGNGNGSGYYYEGWYTDIGYYGYINLFKLSNFIFKSSILNFCSTINFCYFYYPSYGNAYKIIFSNDESFSLKASDLIKL